MRPQNNLPPPPISTRQLSVLFRKTWPLLWEVARKRLWLFALGLLLVMISRAAGLAMPLSMRFLMDNVIGKRQVQWLLPLTAGLFAANVVQGLTSYALTQLFAKEGQRLVSDLRCQVQKHVNRLPMTFHETNKTGALASRILADLEGARNLLSVGIVQFLGSIFTALYALVYLFKINVALTSGTLLGVVAYAVIAKKQMSSRRPLFSKAMEARQDVQGKLIESLSGIRVIKAYQAEEQEARVFAEGMESLSTAFLRMMRLGSLVGLVNGLVVGSIMLGITYFASRLILAGTLTIGGFVAFNAFIMYLLGPALQFGGLTQMLGDALTGLERTRELLLEKTEHDSSKRQRRLENIEGSVSFEEVSFSYIPSAPVLHDISFEAKPGTVTALVGPSGAGKSTISGLVAAFYEPSKGDIRVDGIDLSTIRLDSYRSRLGVVFQDTFLFDGTIQDNISFARPTATQSEILAASHIAHVHEFAEKMPQGYATLVGERGVRLSGGQQQRISLARAFLAAPRILILDEPTSNLDSESEAAIQEAMTSLLKDRTTFIIAHRLSTIHRADQILLVEGGCIRERGTHQSLYDARGRYYDLYTRQQAQGSDLFEAPLKGPTRPTGPDASTVAAKRRGTQP